MNGALKQLQSLLEERAYRVTMFHGTAFKNVRNILDTGLWMSSFVGEKDRGRKALNFLTPEFERAASYGIGGLKKRNKIPAILEVVISKPKRVSKLKDDWHELDQRLSPYKMSHEDKEEMLDSFKESLVEKIQSIAKKLRIRLSKNSYKNKLPGAWEDFDGFNLYKFAINVLVKAADKTEADRSMIVRLVNKTFPHMTTTGLYVDLTRNGIFKLTPQYYDSLEQGG